MQRPADSAAAAQAGKIDIPVRPRKELAMRWRIAILPLALAAALAGEASAQSAGGSTAQCRDGTYSAAHERDVACANHGGIVRWYGKSPRGDGEAVETAKAIGSGKASEAKGHEMAADARSSLERTAAEGLSLAGQGVLIRRRSP